MIRSTPMHFKNVCVCVKIKTKIQLHLGFRIGSTELGWDNSGIYRYISHKYKQIHIYIY